VLTAKIKAHPLRRSLARTWPRPGWTGVGALALLCSTVTWASLPALERGGMDDQRQWQALGIAPLSSGGATGMAMAPTQAAESIDYAPRRAFVPAITEEKAPTEPAASVGPIRITGRAGDGLYWSLRSAGAAPDVAAAYLAALATQIDVGEVGLSDSFDMVLGRNRELLYAGLTRFGGDKLQLVKWVANGRSEWIDAANVERPAPVQTGLMMPVAGHITSYFGYRYHPILHFTRFHAGLDIGAGWGSPIVAAADGRIASAGWAGGYGRQVQIAHAAGLVSSYAHMSEIVAEPGSFVHAGQVIGYVGSSGLSTGPHVHFEVRQNGTPVNPLGVRLVSAPVVDPNLAVQVQARLKALLSVGTRHSATA
jgi:murein DD-endopeptidase MepM/ murein hydrolase activator NlpD